MKSLITSQISAAFYSRNITHFSVWILKTSSVVNFKNFDNYNYLRKFHTASFLFLFSLSIRKFYRPLDDEISSIFSRFESYFQGKFSPTDLRC